MRDEMTGSARVRRHSRRWFVAGAAGVGGAVALWSWRRMPVAQASGAAAPVGGDVTIVQFSPDGKNLGKATVPRVAKSDSEWKGQLSAISFDVARQEGTERPYSGDTWNNHEKGLYRCVCCDTAIFNSSTKFESGTGWPSFWQPIAKENVVEISDRSLGMLRTAVSCKRCSAHLGHVFDDGPQPTGLRYCMNSAAMKFVKFA